ncbi:hypothetical protein L1887_45993 [Cichorium endivia]|nr:hypothetical protein L1887_45993 [Cichorium endivia]
MQRWLLVIVLAAKISIASNVLGQVIDGRNAGITADYLVRHLRQPVRFSEAILDLQSKLQIDTWIELGPHPTCIPMLKGCYAEAEHAPAFLASFRRGSSSWSSVLGLVKELVSRGIDLDWGQSFCRPRTAFLSQGPERKSSAVPVRLRRTLDPTRGSIEAETATAVVRPSVSVYQARGQSTLGTVLGAHKSTPLQRTWSKATSFLARSLLRRPSLSSLRRKPACTGGTWTRGRLDRPVRRRKTWWSRCWSSLWSASLYLNERDPKQSIEVSLQGDPWSHDGSIVQFFSHSEHRHQKHQYGACRIRVVSVDAAQHDWTKLSHLIQTAAAKVQADSSSVIKTKTIYRNFESIVKYLGGFRGMETVWLSEGGEEATSENSANKPSTNQPKAILGLESKANGSAAHSARLQGETNSDSPMNELTDPSKRSIASKPRHIAGPQLKHFDGRDVLFLFPDGSGTAQMYPNINTGGRLSIYGFDSPYLGHIGAWSRDQADSDGHARRDAGAHHLGHGARALPLMRTQSAGLTAALAFAETDAKPAKITVVNAAHDSGLKPVMASEPEWRTLWSDTAHPRLAPGGGRPLDVSGAGAAAPCRERPVTSLRYSCVLRAMYVSCQCQFVLCYLVIAGGGSVQ